ncbi:TetR/AcrR family transcriptional regulator [bacterium]|nr:TetR/AcrR family transcriptional regulator [bacterium]
MVVSDHETDSKTRIGHCALEIFATKGFAGTSIREIAEAAGVTKPTLYYYFGSKERMYQSLYKGLLEAFFGEMEQVKDQTSGTMAHRLQAVVGLYFRWLNEKPLLATFIHRATFGLAFNMPAFDRDVRVVEEILRDGAAAGEIPETNANPEVALHFIGIVHLYVDRRAIVLRDPLSPDLAQRIVRRFLDGVVSFPGDRENISRLADGRRRGL